MFSLLTEIWAEIVAKGIWKTVKLIWVKISGKDLHDKQIRQIVTQDFEVRRNRLVGIRKDLASLYLTE